MSRRSPSAPDPALQFLERGLIAVVVVAPLPFGSVIPGGRLALELAALVLLTVWILRGIGRTNIHPGRIQTIGLLLLLGFTTLQILPVGETVVRFVASQTDAIRTAAATPPAILATEQAALGVEELDSIHPKTLSLDPRATASALRSGCAYAALWCVALTVGATVGMGRIAMALLLSAAVQSLYGIVVFGAGIDRIWNSPKLAYLDAATGTFVNRNHFAGYLTLALACGLAWFYRDLLRRRDAARGFRAFLAQGGSRQLWFGLLLAIGTAGLLLSLSRTGIAVALPALTWITWVVYRRSRQRRWLLAAVIMLVLGALVFVPLGGDNLAERYRQSDEIFEQDGGRVTVWRDTLRMALAFPWTGSGFGTFATAFPLFRSPEVRLFYTHAHNDYVQAMAEGGLPGMLGLALFLVPLFLTLRHAIVGRYGLLACGAAAGLVASAAHALIDFNLHIPANAALIAILAGLVQGSRCKNLD